MDSEDGHHDDLRLIEELAASFYKCTVEEILHDLKASSSNGNGLVICHPEPASSSSFANETAQLFHRESPHPPPPLLPTHWTNGPEANWLLLPREVLRIIFLKLCAIEIMESAQKVCSLWRSVAMDPSLWTQIDIRNDRNQDEWPSDFVLICHHAINRSRKGCVEITIEHFGDDYLLGYIIIRYELSAASMSVYVAL
ncbi:hypothetical protein MLD38_037213 [Melastoma candidum]|uniref:Uncharacterized protein n=1 Tax=Melastoma candidum TaxID=119954 RepID=A0ACB9LMD5_9MYRT|nr:hypothetical protein MLD38_037213 [Melastoma candidum]